MTISKIKEILNADYYACEDMADVEIYKACGSDMMSEVLAFVKDQAAILTGLLNPQVIRTAEMMDIQCIIFVRGKVPNGPIIDMAREKGICLLATKDSMFTACGLLYEQGIRGGDMGGNCS